MNTGLEKRLALLNARIGGNPITLHMSDNTTRQINGSSKHYHQLWARASERYAAELANEPVPASDRLDDELRLIKDSVKISERASEFNLMWAILSGPSLEDSEDAEDPSLRK
jgi:hypothetical protein